ncbi:MAG: amino acid permease [Candidatus Hydrogenedentes bacterium]|nr:amino acid permease [Candidatus Hydrogenedentota bacterium]
MSNMVGAGPFISIPILMSAMGGPQAMLGWLVAAIICIPDGLVWSELGAAMPGSGGSYVYLREGFGREKLGRLMAFVFIWQFIVSGPLEIASGYIGFAHYLHYIWPGISPREIKLLAAGIGILNIIMLYRRITFISRLTVALWVGSLITALAVIFSGAPHFDPNIAFDFPPDAFKFSLGFFLGLGAAANTGVYDYLGYYDICYIGDEVRDPGRVIPRSIIISLISVALLYFLINLSVIGVVPWREFVPAVDGSPSDYVISTFMEKLHGVGVARVFTVLIAWTCFASVFALLLGYSRILYAAAKDGTFFHIFGSLHPTKDFPHISLLLIGGIACMACFLDLGDVITALVASRILIQFIGQIIAVSLLRKNAPDMKRPFRMWLYPLPSCVAFVGWIFIFVTTKPQIIIGSLSALLLGVAAFFAWAFYTKRWPFQVSPGQA